MCISITCATIYCAYTTNNRRVEQHSNRERSLLERIGEYQRREEDRIATEVRRIEDERKRIERTENAIRALRESDRRTSSLLQELTAEIEILADYFNSSRSIVNDSFNMEAVND